MSQAIIIETEATLADVRRKLHPGHPATCDCSTCEQAAQPDPVEYCGAEVTQSQGDAAWGLVQLVGILLLLAAGQGLIAWLGGH